MLMENNFVPRYKLIQKYILDKIESGEFKEGDKIPSEIELAKMFGVSRVTANSAIKELTTLGVIKRFQGLGSFISDTQFMKSGSSMLFGENTKLNTSNNFLGGKRHKLISIKKTKPSEYLNKMFSLPKDEDLYEIIRLVENNDNIEEIDCSYLPESKINNKNFITELSEEEHKNALNSQYFHEYLKNVVKLNAKYVRVYIRPDIKSFEHPELANLKKKNEALLWDLVVFDERNNIIGLTTTLSKRVGSSAFLTFEV